MLSYSEENHLKAIFHLSSSEKEAVSTTAISEELNTKPASVSDMLKKLADKKLIQYQKYQGVKLTSAGKSLALNVIRKHRLWEVFLVEKLNFNWDEVHEVAEQLEHVNSTLLTNRLDDFLGNPKTDPHGDPIPDQNGNFAKNNLDILVECKAGYSGFVMGVKDSQSSFLQYLDKLGIALGVKILIKEIISFDKSFIIIINDNKEITITKDVAKNILIKQ